jgi:hypothetical protein
MAPAGGTGTPARKQAALWAQREVDAEQRWDAHVAPLISRLDQEIARHKASLDGAVNRFESRLAASQKVIGYGLEEQRHASNLAHRLAAERDHLDGLPNAAQVRQAAMQRQQLQGLALPPHRQPPASRSPAIEL